MSILLIQAARQRLLEDVQDLINEGADVNFRDEEGRTALIEATLNLDIPMMTYLLETAEANVDTEDNFGQTALNHIYEEYTGNNETDLLPAIDLLLRYGADPNHCSQSGDTFLQWAAYNGYMSIAQRLLAAEVDPSLAILEARQGEHEEMIQLLETAMASFNQQQESELDEVKKALNFSF